MTAITGRMECYEFNSRLQRKFNDGACEHCIKYLTDKCLHISEFVEEEEDY